MPGTPLRIAVSMTVAPTSAWTGWDAPEASMKVIFGIRMRSRGGEPPALAAGRASYIGSRRAAPVRRTSGGGENLGDCRAGLAGCRRERRKRRREIGGRCDL